MAKTTFLNLPEEKQQAFKEAVYRLFASNPYEAIGIRDITDAADIALGSFYRYFNNKDEMYLDLFCELELRLIENDIQTQGDYLVFTSPAIVPDTREVLSPKEADFGETFYRVPDAVLHKFYFDGYAESVYSNYREFFTELETRGGLKESVNANFAFYFFITSFFNFIIYMRRLNMFDVETIFRLKSRFFNDIVLPAIIKHEELPKIFQS